MSEWDSVRTHVNRYRGRRFNPCAEVWVYRNLHMPDGPWYSVMQGNRVVGHSKLVAIHEPRFVIQEAGRQRALREGVKNVHAFIVGKLSYTHLFFNAKRGHRLSQRARYNLEAGRFEVDLTCSFTRHGCPEIEHSHLTAGLKSAGFVLLSKDGMSVDGASIIWPH